MGLRRAKTSILELQQAGLASPPGHRGRKYARILSEHATSTSIDGQDWIDLIWLPNRIIGGRPGDSSPLARLREAEGGASALALLMEIYRRSNLIADGGVQSVEMSVRFGLARLGERAAWNVYGRAHEGKWHYAPEPSPLSCFLPKPASCGRVFNLLDGLHLIRCVAYIFDRAPEAGGEPMFPVGWIGEDAEVLYGDASRASAETLLERTAITKAKGHELRKGHEVFVAVGKHVHAPEWVELLRPRWLPDTEPTRRWLAKLQKWSERAEADAAAMTIGWSP